MSQVPHAELVTALQLGDSAFPTGAFAYSWGMGTLLADAQLQRRDLAGFVQTGPTGRWRGIDRPALAGGWRADTTTDLEDWDAQVDLSLWSEPQRRASQEAGAATLAAATRLERAGAREIRASVTAGRMAGHFPVLTGALHRGRSGPDHLAAGGCAGFPARSAFCRRPSGTGGRARGPAHRPRSCARMRRGSS